MLQLSIAYKKFVSFKSSNIKTSERPKNIKGLDDSLLRNYWNKTKYIYDWIIEKYKRKMGYIWKIIHDYNYWKESKDLEPTNCR